MSISLRSNLTPDVPTAHLNQRRAFGPDSLRPRLKLRRTKGSGEKGAGRLKAIIWTLILAAFIYVSFKVVPILINEYQLQDGMQTIARFATVNRQPPEQISAAVLKEAEKDSVPVRIEDIKVDAVNGNVRINVDYSVTVDLTVYQWTLNFHPTASNNALF